MYDEHFFMNKSPSIYKNVLAFAPTVRLGMLVRRDSTWVCRPVACLVHTTQVLVSSTADESVVL